MSISLLPVAAMMIGMIALVFLRLILLALLYRKIQTDPLQLLTLYSKW
jgi:hypothetical protein